MHPRRVCRPLPTAGLSEFRTHNSGRGIAALVSPGGGTDLSKRVHSAVGGTGVDGGGGGGGLENGLSAKLSVAKRGTSKGSGDGQRVFATGLSRRHRRFSEKNIA